MGQEHLQLLHSERTQLEEAEVVQVPRLSLPHWLSGTWPLKWSPFFAGG